MIDSAFIKCTTSWNTLFWLVSFFTMSTGFSQQIQWAKLYTLPEEDQITCITKDNFGDLYAGGKTRRGLFFPGAVPRAVLYKLNSDGDTIYSLWPGIYGEVNAITVDNWGNVKMAVYKEGLFPNGQTQLHLLTMTPEGLIFRRDTIPNILYVTNSCIGKDSSWILCGWRMNDLMGGSLWTDFYVQRIRKDGTIEPFVSLNPNHPDCRANRVEQLPNGKYLVSGYVGSRIATYTLNEDLSDPQFNVWYQTPDLSNLSSGRICRINNQRFMIAGEGGPCIVGQVDSLKQKIWMHRQIGAQIPPQAMADGSVVFGYLTSIGPPNPFYRIGPDSNIIWYVSIKDSLIARGINNAVRLTCFTYFEDQSAVIGGVVQNPATSRDPIFLRISNVGIPVTSLSKPKSGPLKNETLAPWPNPTSGTLYLKQHFDKAEIHFYTLSGKEMGGYTIAFGQAIQVQDYPAGIYLYRAVIDGKAYSGKIVKQ